MGEAAKVTAKTPEPKRESSTSRTNKPNFSQQINSPVDQILFLQRTVGNRAVQRLLKSGVIQARLTIGQPGDIYEQEADRVAEQVMRMPNPSTTGRRRVSEDNKAPSIKRMCSECDEELHRQTLKSELGNLSEDELTRKTDGIQIQRMCSECEETFSDSVGAASSRDRSRQACPELNGRDGALTLLHEANNYPNLILQRQPMEEEEEILQTKEVCGATPEISQDVESEINDVRGGGQPLSDSVRAFFEPRFGQDFSQVRIHTDSNAGESAKAVNALAYTVGQDVVFSEGQYSPGTESGKKLIAHELTHVVQQQWGTQQLQRFATCKPARLSLEECPARQPGEMQRARDGQMVFLGLSGLVHGERGALIANFDIGSAEIKPNLHQTIYWKKFLKRIALNRSQWGLLGFTDCQGEESLNKRLREQRAEAVFNILPKDLQPQIISREGASIYDCITGNSSAADRTLNRSVALIFLSYVTSLRAEEITGDPKNVCRDDKKAQADRRMACVQPFVIAADDGKNPTTMPSLDKAREIWGKCCINLSIKPTKAIAKTAFKVLDKSLTFTPTAEEDEMLKEAGADCIPVFVVQTFEQNGKQSKNISGGGVTYAGRVIVVEGTEPTVIAHEMSHSLSVDHSDDTGGTVAGPSGAYNKAVGEKVTANICEKARRSVYVTKKAGGKYDCCLLVSG